MMIEGYKGNIQHLLAYSAFDGQQLTRQEYLALYSQPRLLPNKGQTLANSKGKTEVQ